jgi:hypothetical protein
MRGLRVFGRSRQAPDTDMRLDRKQVRVLRGKAEQPEDRVVMTPAEAVDLVWELSQEVFSLSGKYDVESRLQRHVVSIHRKGR